MNGRYESDDLEDMHEMSPAADREISLGTGAMLGIFLALVLVCGAFFGFGYSMGHKTGPVVTAGAVTGEADAASPAQVAEGGGKSAAVGSGGTGATDAPAVVVKPSAGAAPVLSKKAPTQPATVVGDETPPMPTPVAKATPKPYITVPTVAAPGAGMAAAAAPASPGAVPIYVQISAVSHQEDAQLLMTALKRRGYEATVRHAPQDQLLHVQLGPYANKREADAMRQRLSADGYNAILK